MGAEDGGEPRGGATAAGPHLQALQLDLVLSHLAAGLTEFRPWSTSALFCCSQAAGGTLWALEAQAGEGGCLQAAQIRREGRGPEGKRERGKEGKGERTQSFV